MRCSKPRASYPILRSVPNGIMTRGEANRLVNMATKLLVSTVGTTAVLLSHRPYLIVQLQSSYKLCIVFIDNPSNLCFIVLLMLFRKPFNCKVATSARNAGLNNPTDRQLSLPLVSQFLLSIFHHSMLTCCPRELLTCCLMQYFHLLPTQSAHPILVVFPVG